MNTIRQAMLPHGWLGRVFGWSMDLLNRHAFRAVLDAMRVQPDDAILEIGFGTGALARMLASRARSGYVAGVDPSPLMLETALRRNRKAIDEGRVELRSGDASHLDWPDSRFDKVCAVHSFQFWADPMQCFAEIHRVLRPGGLLMLVLRAHRGGEGDAWLPNPISRTDNEVEQALDALQMSGYVDCEVYGRTRNSSMLVGRKR